MKSTLLKLLIYLILLGVGSESLYALNYTRIGALSAADNISVYSVSQDEDGALWLNSSLGVLRFNGHSIEQISRPLPMHALNIAKGYLVYAFGPDYILRHNTRTRTTSRIATGTLHNLVHSPTYAEGDSIFVCSGNKVMVSRGDTLCVYCSLDSSESISGMLRTSNGDLLVCSHSGRIFHLDSPTSHVCLLESGYDFNSLFQDSSGNIWTGLLFGGCVKYDASLNQLALFSVPVRETRTFCEGLDGTIYIGSVDYLYSVAPDGRCLVEPSDSPGAHSVCSLYTDRDGNVWIGTFYSGVYFCNLQSFPFTDIKLPESGMLRIVNDIVQDKRGDIWVLTDRHGMYRLSRGKWTLIPGTVEKKIKSAWYDSSSDTIWLGQYNADIESYHIPSGRWRSFPFVEGGKKLTLATDGIIERDGLLYLGTSSGLWIFDYTASKTIDRRLGDFRGTIYDLAFDSRGYIWIGSNGLYLCADGENIREARSIVPAIPASVNQRGIFSNICADSTSVWMSVVGIGCMRIENDKVTIYNKDNCGLADNNTTVVESLGEGMVMVGTRSGISILDSKKSLCYNYSRANGLQLSSTRDGAVTPLSDGTYIIGGVDGLEYLNGEVAAFRSPSSLSIDAVFVNNDPFISYNPSHSKLILDHNQDNFSFDVTAFDYSAVLPLCYEYRMVGFEEAWRTFDPSERILFMNMSPGHYELQVRAFVPGAPGALCASSTLAVVVRPAWYATLFAKIAFALLLIMLVGFALYVVYSRLLLMQKLRAREKENEERTRFFIKVSHELRTPLTLMIGQLEVFFGKHGHSVPGVKNLERSYSSAQEMNKIISSFVEMENKDLTPQVDDLPSEEELLSITSNRVAEGSVAPIQDCTMLIVDDNAQMRSLLRSIFSSDYKLLEAVNGAEGLEVARMHQPDIIISDVMMPVMDGLTLCAKLRADFETCHIPIVLITAHVSEKHNLEGMKIGADDYIAKPFTVDLLKARCRNLLENRRLLLEKYGVSSQSSRGHESKLLNAAIGAVERNLFSPDLSVPKLCEELSMSKTSLTEHLSKACGLTPREFIEDVRLRHAAQFLQDGKRVSEVSDELGFSSPKYFTIRFRQKFGCPPSKFVNN